MLEKIGRALGYGLVFDLIDALRNRDWSAVVEILVALFKKFAPKKKASGESVALAETTRGTVLTEEESLRSWLNEKGK